MAVLSVLSSRCLSSRCLHILIRAHLCFVVYADELLHSQQSLEQRPFIDQLVQELFGGNIDIHVPGLHELKDIWSEAKQWLEQAKTQLAEEATPPANLWVLAMAYLVENFLQQKEDAEFLRARLEVEKACGRLGSEAEIDDLAVALGLPFYRDESLITSEPAEHWRPGKSENDGDGRRAEDAVSACTSSTDHRCRADCPLACHMKHHKTRGGRCWHFIIYWQLVPKNEKDSCTYWATKVFSEERCRRFENMVNMAAKHLAKDKQTCWTLRKEVIVRMLSIYWNEFAKWIDESVDLGGRDCEQQWLQFNKFRNQRIDDCEPLRGAVKAFGTAGSAVLRDVAIDA